MAHRDAYLVCTVTRNQILAALDHVLGNTSHRMLREIQSSIIRRRVESVQIRPMRDVRDADFGNIFRELRTAAAKTNGRR